MEFEFCNLSLHKVKEEIVNKYNKVTFIADGSRSCDVLDVIAIFLENGYKMELKRYKGRFEEKAIKLIFRKE